MSVRKVGVCAVAVLAVGGLAGCRTKAGAAAVVGDDRINQSDLSSLVVTGATVKAGTQPPKTTALTFLIQQDLMERALAASGGVPSDSELAQSHDVVLSNQFQQQVAGDSADKLLRQQAGQVGLTAKFDAVYVRTLELEHELITRKKITSQPRFLAEIDKLHVPVSVSQRFGVWDPSALSLKQGVDPDLSSVVTLPSSSSSPSPQ